MEPIDDVPRGYRFLPTAKELVDYLVNHVAGTPIPCRALEFADVYGTEPWNLLGSDRQEGYFFTERKPMNSRDWRVKRKAGNGYWHGNKNETLGEFIVNGRIASVQKNYLSFRKVEGQRKKNSGWTMCEYAMCYFDGGFERRVLCHVKKSSQNSNQASVLAASDGGGDLGITTEMIEAARISSSSVDHGGEQMHCPLDHSFKKSLEELETFLMSDDTIAPTSSTEVTWVAEYEASLRSVLTTTPRAAL
ncbi:NAC domain-containing protein 41-like [Musa acuminata AAA Group]|uniref:NAC domain-containing protein 41-like n=1 Tax=Musa acuminata AAA Group TaxID=214697 RepID=UPI0031D15CBF